MLDDAGRPPPCPMLQRGDLTAEQRKVLAIMERTFK
jgi:hypothetical protein